MKYLNIIILFLFTCFCGCTKSHVGSEKVVWNQEHTHYIKTIYKTGEYFSVLINGEEYLKFAPGVLLRGRFVSENEVKIVSSIEAMKNKIDQSPIKIDLIIASGYKDFISDTLLQVFSEGPFNHFTYSEKKLWNQDSTHYIHFVSTNGDYESIFIDGIEYLKFSSDAASGVWKNNSQIRVVSDERPRINRIHKSPIPVELIIRK